ncbi:MAG: hypothetical protein JWR56_2745 [Massilia sp.]|jgi:hypothetical protein|nr:hypothetical protein [Massilia sp.]
MKRLLLLVSCAVALSACSMFKTKMPPPPVAQAKPVDTRLLDANGAPIERIAFRAGISSVTVERLGKQQACFSNEGAGLVTEPGPVEVYRILCDGGKVFMARCELRQCKAM